MAEIMQESIKKESRETTPLLEEDRKGASKNSSPTNTDKDGESDDSTSEPNRKPIAASPSRVKEQSKSLQESISEEDENENGANPPDEPNEDHGQQPPPEIKPFPCLGQVCLKCTGLGLKNKKLCCLMLTVLGTMTFMLLTGSIAMGITLSEVKDGETMVSSIIVPPLTVYEYPLEKSELIRNQGLEVTVENNGGNTGLIQLALNDKQLQRKYIPFPEKDVKVGSILMRYWPNITDAVRGDIKCNSSSKIKAQRIKSNSDFNYKVNCNHKLNLTTDALLNIKEFNCSDGFVQAEEIASSTNPKYGDIVIIYLCDSVGDFEVNFTENVYHITNGIFLDIQLGESQTTTPMLAYNNLISELPKIQTKPYLYISTEYVQYNKHNTRIEMEPVTLEIKFKHRPELWGYYTGVMLISLIPFLTVVLICYCFYSHRKKKSFTIGCLYHL